MELPRDIVVLATEEHLATELETALAAFGPQAPRQRHVADRRTLGEAIRAKPPDVVFVEFGADPLEVGRLAREFAALTPPLPVVGVFHPRGFSGEVSESGLLVESMRAGVRDFLRRPVSTFELRAILERLAGAGGMTESASPALGRVVSFISNKGGVGKSTLAVNTAVRLAQRAPGRVLLVDASLQLGVAAPLLDLQPTATFTDVARERDRLDATLLRQIALPHESGLHLLAAPADAVEALEIDDALMAQVITLARRAYDFVVIDTFPMFDRVIVAALDLSDHAYVVVENVMPTLLGAVRLLDVLERIGFPAERQSVVVNREQGISGSLSLADIATRLGRPIEFVLPYDKRVIAAANSGQPVASRWLNLGAFSRALDQLVAHVVGDAP